MKRFSEIEYIRPNIEELSIKLNTLIKEFKDSNSYDDARATYLKILDEMGTLNTAYSLSYIRNTIDTKDEFYDAERNYMNDELPKLTVVEIELMKTLLDSQYIEDFRNEFGDMLIKNAEAALRVMDESIIPNQIKLNNLEQKYSKLAASAMTEFRGEEKNFYGLLKYMVNPDRETRRDAFIAWADLYASIADELDEIMDQLIDERTDMANKLGFKDYTSLAYVQRERYDYDASDVEVFRNQVRDIIVPFADRLIKEQGARIGVDKIKYYDEQLRFQEGNATPVGNTNQMIEMAGRMYREMSPETGEFFDFMIDNELFDLETRNGKHLGGYCTFMPDYKAPFIFSNFNGTSADVDVLTHEAGHAFEAYYASREQILQEYIHSTSEINEIHSMAMELFAYPWLELFFDDSVDKYKYAHMAENIITIPYLVSVDEFQHRLYDKPNMSAKERRAVWKEIEKIYLPWRDYDGNEFLEEGGFWMQKQHIFLYPFYYVDYALAQLGACELYIRGLSNKEEAWKDYMNLCRTGGSKGYFELLEVARLSNPLREGSVKRITDGISKVIDELSVNRLI